MAGAYFVIAAACLVYGVTVMLVGSGTWFFAVWYALGALFALIGLALRAGWWAALPTAARGLALGVGCLVLAGLVAGSAFIARDFGDTADEGLDYIVVLGAQVREDGPSIVLRNRLDAAYDYLAENEGTICIVSGGKGANEPASEASVMAGYLQSRGIAESRIIQEDKSLNTVQNIRNSMQLMGKGGAVGIVTNNFHLFRALQIARKQGLDDVCGIAAPSSPWFLPNNMLREFFGLAKDAFCGNL